MAKPQKLHDGFIHIPAPKCRTGREASKYYASLKNPDDLLMELVDLLSGIDDSKSNLKLNSKSYIAYDGRIRY